MVTINKGRRYYLVMNFLDDLFAGWSIRVHKLYCCTSMDGRHRNH
jgi:hypothetical protein